MPQFFAERDPEIPDRIVITGEDAHHIARSLRMAVGDPMTVCDRQGVRYEGRISAFEDDRAVYVEILSAAPSASEPACRITLFQALPKGDKLEQVIQKAVECGAFRIVPFESANCVVRIKPETEERKRERRQKIAAEAPKQSGRGILPEVSETVDFRTMLTMAAESELCLFCYEGTGTRPIGGILRELAGKLPQSIAVVVGSEGGFSPAEAEAAKAGGACLTGLGKRILRTETASVFALACISCMTELG